MHPLITVLELGDRALPIGSYGVALTLALWVGAALTLRAASRAGLDTGATIAVIGLCVGGGFAGAAALHALVQLLRGAPLHGGGLACMGGLAGGLVALRLGAAALELPWLRLADLAAVPVAVAHALGRVGCLLGGCCFGAPWQGPLALRYSDPLAPAHAAFARHPWPLYEAAGLLVLALGLALAPALRPGHGRRALAYLAGYAVLRFALEPLRGDAVRGVWAGVSTGQLTSLALLVGTLIAARRLKRTPLPRAARTV